MAGCVFVAVLLGLTMGAPGQQLAGILAGLITNVIILLVVMGVWAIWQRLRRR